MKTIKASSPVESGREELGNQPLVIRTKNLRSTGFVTFAIKVVWVECTDGLQGSLVLFIHEVHVGVLAVPPEINFPGNENQRNGVIQQRRKKTRTDRMSGT
jgi:hypothetical protein